MISHSLHCLSKLRNFHNGLQFWSELGLGCNCKYRNRRVAYRKFVVKAVDSDADGRLQNDAVVVEKSEKDNAEKPLQNVQNAVAKLHDSIGSLPVFAFSVSYFSLCNQRFFGFLNLNSRSSLN